MEDLVRIFKSPDGDVYHITLSDVESEYRTSKVSPSSPLGETERGSLSYIKHHPSHISHL